MAEQAGDVFSYSSIMAMCYYEVFCVIKYLIYNYLHI